MNVYLEEVIKRVPAKVKEYEYGMNSSIKLRDIGKKASEYAKALILVRRAVLFYAVFLLLCISWRMSELWNRSLYSKWNGVV